MSPINRKLKAPAIKNLPRAGAGKFAPPAGLGQLALDIPNCACGAAEQMDAAKRVFESVLAVAERMRVDRATAMQSAIASALRRTGIDLAQEIGTPPAAISMRQRAALDLGEMQRLRTFLRRRQSVVAEKICTDVLFCDPANRQARMRIASAMLAMGWNKTRLRVNGARRWIYRRALAGKN